MPIPWKDIRNSKEVRTQEAKNGTCMKIYEAKLEFLEGWGGVVQTKQALWRKLWIFFAATHFEQFTRK